jgi:hypothetical protein
MKKEKLSTFAVQNLFCSGHKKQKHEESTIQEYLNWMAFIDYINQSSDSTSGYQRKGNDFSSYYGLKDGATWGRNCLDNVTLITLYEAIDMFDIKAPSADDYALTRCQRVMPINETIIVTNEHSRIYGECILIEESFQVSPQYGGGIAHISEQFVTSTGEKFVERSKDTYRLEYSTPEGGYICRDDDYVYYGYYDTSGDQSWFISEDYVEDMYNNNMYINSDVANYYGVYWNEDEDEYTSKPEPKHNAGYHSLLRRWKCDDRTPFRIGFEIEKEDDECVEIGYQEVYDQSDWIKEDDGSLDGNNGFELVSPTMDLFKSTLEDDIAKHEDLRNMINADYSDNCGGHINLSSNDYTPVQLFEGLSGFFPLLYSMYPHRLDENYCKAKEKHQYYREEKYSAVHIKSYLIEFRLFPAVKSVTNLLWRRDLIRIMCNNINADELAVLRMMTNPQSTLHKHLIKIYSFEDMIDKIDSFIKYANTFSNKKITPPKHVKNFKEKKAKPENDTPTNELGA